MIVKKNYLKLDNGTEGLMYQFTIGLLNTATSKY